MSTRRIRINRNWNNHRAIAYRNLARGIRRLARNEARKGKKPHFQKIVHNYAYLMTLGS